MRNGSQRPRLVVLGSRGCPDVQGGVERHIEALAPLLAARGWDVEVIGRARYLPPGRRTWSGVTVTPLWAPKGRSLEAIAHTTLGLFVARLRRPDVVHIHAIGPSITLPLARLLGLRVLVTHHGYDYDRAKWGRIAKATLKLGEWFGMRWSHGRIAVSNGITGTMRARHGRDVAFVPNGVWVHPEPSRHALDAFGLAPHEYVLTVSRLVPEKRQLDLIEAYARLHRPAFKLVIVGGADHPGRYETMVRERAQATPGVVLTGFRSGAELAGLFANAGLFVLPSSHEGLPIALLEALAYGVPSLASDIPANLEVGLPSDAYFPLGDVGALSEAIDRRMALQPNPDARRRQAEETLARFGWERIADETSECLTTLLPAARRKAATSLAVNDATAAGRR